MLTQHHLDTTKALLGSAVAMAQMSEEDSQEILGLLQSGIKNTKSNAPEELWRTVESCKFLKCSKPTLIDQAKKKGLQIIRVGSTLRFKKSEILKLGGLSNVN